MKMTLHGPIPPEADDYVRRELDDSISQALGRGEYVNLRGGRQTGKTSLLLRLRTLLQRQGAASAYVDVSPLGEVDFQEDRWYQALGEAIRTSLMPTILQDKVPPAPTNTPGFPGYIYQVVKAVQPKRPLVVLVDEVTAVPIPLQRPLFSTIRAMFNQRYDAGAPAEACAVLFVFAGSFDPERITDSQNSPFNVAATFDTSDYDFSSEQVHELAAKLGLGEISDDVYRWTRGHPYLTNRLLDLSSGSKSVDECAQELLVDDSNLAHVGRRLAEAGDAASRLALKIQTGEQIPYSRGLDEHLDRLMVMGLITSDPKGNAVIRCELYARFLDHLQQIRDTPMPDLAEHPTPVDFLPEGPLRDHAAMLVDLAPQVAIQSPALSAICAGLLLETALLLELEQRGDLSQEIQVLKQEVDTGKVEPSLSIGQGDTQPTKWSLAQMIEIARICGLVSKPASQVSHALRGWRNLVHPARFRQDYPDGVPPEVADAAISNALLLLTELRARHP